MSKVTKSKTDFQMPYDEEILVYAFRYALGRMTYATSTVSDGIIDWWECLDKHTKYLIKKEIKEAIKEDRASMDMDVQSWKRILKLKI